jgi:CheY-like chemotaxis protein
MVYGFVKQSGGHVSIHSEVGLGTTINLYFPRMEGQPGDSDLAMTQSNIDNQACETILVVEDDDRVRRLAVTRLRRIGYKVLEASDGPKAIDILSMGNPVDLIFTDLIMPGGMSGKDVAARARQLRPNVKVLLTSGYAEELFHADDLQREQLKLLRKPYHHADLVAVLRDVLRPAS